MNFIGQYVHCAKCLEELPDNESPASFQDVSVGFTPAGLQVWCNRHDRNIIHIDFEGCKHPASGSEDAVVDDHKLLQGVNRRWLGKLERASGDEALELIEKLQKGKVEKGR